MKTAVSHRVDEFWSQFNPLKCRKTREMKLKALVYLFFIFQSSFGKAETQYLLVDPGASKTSNYYRYYNDVRRAYETLKAQNKPTTVIAKDGSWKLAQQSTETLSSYSLTEEGKKRTPTGIGVPDYPPIQSSARGIEDVISAVKKMNPKDGDSVVIYFTAHGNAPRNPDDPSTATIIGWNEEYEFNQLADALAKLPKGVKLKLISTTCFSGGIHSIARKLNNVCSSSTTNHLYESSAGDYQEFRFNKGLWDTFSKTKSPSFAQANLEGFKGDDANFNLGRLSSFDYIDWVLKDGPYKKTGTSRPEMRWVTKDGDRVYQVVNGFPSHLPPEASILSNSAIPSSLEAGVCKECGSGGVQSDLDKLTKLAQTLSEVAQQAVVQDLSKKADLQSAQVRTIFHDVIDDMKKNGASYLQTAKMYEDKYTDLVRRWNEHKAKFKNAEDITKFKNTEDITKWLQGEGDGQGEARAKIQKEFDTLKSNAERDLKQYSFNHQMLERLERLDEFNKKATPEQKKKFVQLLQCEWEPL